MCANGEGTHRSVRNAARWYHMAADKGDAIAQKNLAALYENELKNMRRAIEWYRKAALRGCPHSEACLMRICAIEPRELHVRARSQH